MIILLTHISMKNIAILGTGQVGQKLAVGFLKNDYSVTFGTHHPDKTMEWQDPSLEGSKVLAYADAAKIGDLVVMALKGTAAESVVTEVISALQEKTVMDVTNPIADVPPVDGVLKFFTNLDESLMERLQNIAPQAHFVKAFNSVGNAHFINPQFGTTPSMFICGNDADAKKEIATIVRAFGWDVEDMGKATAARAIEPLCMLWCIPGLLHNEWMHAFKVLKK